MLMNRTTPFMVPVDDANPAIIKDEALCSECGHCFAVCEEEIGVAAKYLLNQREAYQCIGCGQCSASCPEKAITGRPHYKIVKELIQDPEKIVEEKGLKQVTDTGAIEAIVDKVIAENPDKVNAYKGGKVGLMGWFVGQVIKESRGKANPQVVNRLLAAKLA